VGSLACYGREGEAWTYFEIDPIVERIARDARYFTFLRDCPPATRVVIGDGRLSLIAEPDSSFDLIVIDAFGSDAIPVHLLTREATALYLRKLRPDGILAFHISNRYLDLEPVVASTATSLGAASLVGVDGVISRRQADQYKSLSRWMVVSRTATRLAPLSELPGWGQPTVRADAVWTDDFSNVLGVFEWRRQ
jgi:spermidine synthase